MNEALAAVAHKAFECQLVCNECFDACLHEENVKMMADCIRLDRECADICALLATFSSREGALTTDLVSLCAIICNNCAAECEKHEMEHCQRCAKMCRECADLCEAYA